MANFLCPAKLGCSAAAWHDSPRTIGWLDNPRGKGAAVEQRRDALKPRGGSRGEANTDYYRRASLSGSGGAGA